MLAGYAAAAKLDGYLKADLKWYEDEYLVDNFRHDRSQDFNEAAAMCHKLPRGRTREFHALLTQTIQALHELEVWQRVITLADALIVAGKLEDDALQLFLPEPRKGFPSARCRADRAAS